MKNWLITGGCGFIGTALIRALKAEPGNRVLVLDNLSVGRRRDLKSVTEFVEIDPARIEDWDGDGFSCRLVVGDIADAALLERATRGADVVVHLAGNTGVPRSVEAPREDMLANVVGTFNVLDACRENGVPRFVFASSGAPAGIVTPPIHEELPSHPVSPYGASKLAGEGYCSAFFHSYGVETVALRFGNVYGPGSHHKTSVVAKFIRKAIDGETVEIYGTGEQTRDFIYIDDLVDAVLRAATVEGIGGEVFQIASGKEMTINDMVEHLSLALARHGYPLNVERTEPRRGDVLRNFSDTSKARSRLGWMQRVSVDEGIERTIESFISD